MKFFCPNCGYKITEPIQFCPNCGYKVSDIVKSLQQQDASVVSKTKEKPQVQENKQVKFDDNHQLNKQVKKTKANKAKVKPTNHHGFREKLDGLKDNLVTHKWGWLLGLLIALVLLFVGLNNYYQPRNQIARAFTVLNNPNKNGAHYITTNDSQAKINRESVKPFQKEFHNGVRNGMTKHYFVKHELKALKHNSHEYYDFQKTGNVWLFFPKYKLKVDTVSIPVKTNLPNLKIYQNGKYVATSYGHNYEKNFNHLLYGIYKFTAKGTVHGQKVSASDVYDGSGDVDDVINLDININTFNIKSVPNAEVYVNNKKVGNLDKNGNYTLKNYPIHKNTKLYLKANLNGKMTQSESVKLYSHSTKVSPLFPGMLNKKDSEHLLKNVFVDNDGDPDNHKDIADNFDQGGNNGDFKNLMNQNKGFSNNDSLTGYKYSVSVDDVLPNGDGKTKVDYTLTVTQYYNDGGKEVQVYKSTAIVGNENNKNVIFSLGKPNMVSQHNDSSNDD